MAAYARQTVDYYKKNGVRVVNMSWRITEPQIAGSLASVEPDPAKRKARAKAVFETINKSLEESFRSAPNILFVPAPATRMRTSISSAASPRASTLRT
jgi:hypothetical protein